MAGDGDPAAESELLKGFSTLVVSRPDPSVGVYEIRLNRPRHLNALNESLFADLRGAAAAIAAIPSARAIVLSASGPHFCAGLDLTAFSFSPPLSAGGDPAAAADELRRWIEAMQASFTALEQLRVPVVAAVRGACIGGGVDMVTACDVRVCDAGASFVVKEVDMAMVADLGVLQRLPAIVGYGRAVDLALTGRRVGAEEALAIGLVTRVFPSPEALEVGAFQIAKELAEKSAWAVQGTKAVLLQGRDLTVQQGLAYVAAWNVGMLRSHDLQEAVKAFLEKRKPVFSKL